LQPKTQQFLSAIFVKILAVVIHTEKKPATRTPSKTRYPTKKGWTFEKKPDRTA